MRAYVFVCERVCVCACVRVPCVRVTCVCVCMHVCGFSSDLFISPPERPRVDKLAKRSVGLAGDRASVRAARAPVRLRVCVSCGC